MFIMEEKRCRVLLCEDSTEGILSAVHRAYRFRYGHKYITIETRDDYEPSLFCDVEEIAVDLTKAEAVAKAVMEKISREAWNWVRMASMAGEPGKAQAVYRFLNVGFAVGPKVCRQLANDHVLTAFKLMRRVGRESDKLKGFVRFHELESGLLFSTISPKHQQLYILGEHFCDRMPEENWVIYDEQRQMACVHRAHGGFVIARDTPVNKAAADALSGKEQEFLDLWQTFFDHIEIRERRNPKLQMNLMPKRFWKHMDEMNGRVSVHGGPANSNTAGKP